MDTTIRRDTSASSMIWPLVRLLCHRRRLCNYRCCAMWLQFRITCYRRRISFCGILRSICSLSASVPDPVMANNKRWWDFHRGRTMEREVTYRLTDNVTNFTLCFNYRIAICVKSTGSFLAYVRCGPHFIDLFQYLLSGNRCNALIWWWTFLVSEKTQKN